MSKWIHRLSNINLEECTATCAFCGPQSEVRIRKGRAYCRVPIREAKALIRERQKKLKPVREVNLHKKCRRESKHLLSSSCEICGGEDRLVVDHCHKKIIFRGTLCHWCNVGLGFFREEQERLILATQYLKRHQD